MLEKFNATLIARYLKENYTKKHAGEKKVTRHVVKTLTLFKIIHEDRQEHKEIRFRRVDSHIDDDRILATMVISD